MSYTISFKWSESIELDAIQLGQLRVFGNELKNIINCFYADYYNYDLVENDSFYDNEMKDKLNEASKMYIQIFENCLKRLSIYCEHEGLTDIIIKIKKADNVVKEFKVNYIYSHEYQFRKILTK